MSSVCLPYPALSLNISGATSLLVSSDLGSIMGFLCFSQNLVISKDNYKSSVCGHVCLPQSFSNALSSFLRACLPRVHTIPLSIPEHCTSFCSLSMVLCSQYGKKVVPASTETPLSLCSGWTSGWLCWFLFFRISATSPNSWKQAHH